VTELIGARTPRAYPGPVTYRNGYRQCRWDTLTGIELQIRKLRQGSYFSSFLESRKRREQALLNVVHQTYTSTGSRPASGPPGLRVRHPHRQVSVSRICRELERTGRGLPHSPSGGDFPSLAGCEALKVRNSDNTPSKRPKR
jgi:transposase-like protein